LDPAFSPLPLVRRSLLISVRHSFLDAKTGTHSHNNPLFLTVVFLS
jgi:hypothetical protein